MKQKCGGLFRKRKNRGREGNGFGPASVCAQGRQRRRRGRLSAEAVRLRMPRCGIPRPLYHEGKTLACKGVLTRPSKEAARTTVRGSRSASNAVMRHPATIIPRRKNACLQGRFDEAVKGGGADDCPRKPFGFECRDAASRDHYTTKEKRLLARAF